MRCSSRPVVLDSTPTFHRCHLWAAGVLLLVFVGSAHAQQLKWVTQAGGPGFDSGHGIAVDEDKNVYVTGDFRDVATFGRGEDNETTLTAFSTGIFVAKYSRAGRLAWVSQAGPVTGTGIEIMGASALAIDGLGRTIVTGYFTGTATFGRGEARETTLTSIGGADIFVAKYDANGALRWAVRAGGPEVVLVQDNGTGVAVDEEGNSYLTGYFRGPATFESTDGSVLTVPLLGATDVFVAKYNRQGVLQWATRAGGDNINDGRSIAVDAKGNSYVTGSFAGTIAFGEGANEQVLVSGGGWDTFLARYSRDGALKWVTQVAAVAGGFNEGNGVAVDPDGNSSVTGWFQEELTFGLGETNEITLRAPGERSSFVARYDRRGALIWARHVDTGDSAGANAIAVDSLGNSYVTGSLGGNTSTFGPGEENETTLVRMAGVQPNFVAKYDRQGALSWARQGGGVAIAADAGGNSYVTGSFGDPPGPPVENTITFGLGEANETTLVSAGLSDGFVAKYSHHGDLESSSALDD